MPPLSMSAGSAINGPKAKGGLARVRKGVLLSERGKVRTDQIKAAEDRAEAAAEAEEKRRLYQSIQDRRATEAATQAAEEAATLAVFESRERATSFAEPNDGDVMVVPLQAKEHIELKTDPHFFDPEPAEAVKAAPATSRQRLLLDALLTE